MDKSIGTRMIDAGALIGSKSSHVEINISHARDSKIYRSFLINVQFFFFFSKFMVSECRKHLSVIIAVPVISMILL